MVGKLFFSLLFLCSAFSYAQNNTRISIITFVKSDGILIRWAPSGSTLFDQSMVKGWNLERYEVINGQVDPLTKMLIPIPAIQATELPKENPNRNILESYNASKNQKSAHDLSYLMLMLNSGLSQEAGRYFRLFYKDSTAQKNKQYEYRIHINGQPTPVGKTTVSSSELSVLAGLSRPAGKSFRRQAILEWNADSLKSHYSGYWIERSTDNVNFNRINKNPFVFLKSEYEKNKTMASFQDTTTLVGNTYYYRITGISHFGETGLSSPSVKVYIRHIFEGDLNIDSVSLNGESTTFSFRIFEDAPALRKLTQQLVLQKSENALGPFQTISSFSPEGNFENFRLNQVNDNRVFYRLVAVSNEGDSLTSHPYYFFYFDQIPPAIPQGLTGQTNAKGVVTLNWKTNADTDLKGYRIFRANALHEEFIEINKHFITDTIFRDTLNLNTLNRNVYYCIRAVDQNFNNSQASIPLKINRPDVTPPIPVVITKTEMQQKGIHLAWNNSNSTDIREIRLIRTIGTKDTLLIKWSALLPISEYFDSTITSGVTYRYKIEVEDSAANMVQTNSPLVKYENGKRPAPQLPAATVDREKQEIRLNWDYPFARNEIYCYYIYRKKNDGKWILVQTLKETSSFKDKDLNMNNTYEYRIQAVFISGIKSEFSNTVKVDY